uniref:Uncharacterized protein n=1 Tax=Anguilla anguilla TaxID=7936 RepID=A0A0E9RSR7_ANGAN
MGPIHWVHLITIVQLVLSDQKPCQFDLPHANEISTSA